jgi:hypothetical protein
MGNCPVNYDYCAHIDEDVCDKDCVEPDILEDWRKLEDYEDEFYNYERDHNKLHRHCIYHHEHSHYRGGKGYCKFCTVKFDKAYNIIFQNSEQNKDISYYDFCLSPNERFRIERIYEADIDDIRFNYECRCCKSNVVFCVKGYNSNINKINKINIDENHMYCQDCYLQKEAEFYSAYKNDYEIQFESDFFIPYNV